MNTFLQSFSRTIRSHIMQFSVRERLVFVIALGALLVTSYIFLFHFSRTGTESLPAYGGTLREGVVGVPRFVNPLFAQEGSELGLTRLVYSGLLRKADEGVYIPDLAKSYTVSSDGKTYTFVLRENIRFHDNAKLTVDDVLFTIEKITDPAIKSPLAVNWQGVQVKKVDATTLTFTLSQPFAGFLDNLTIGILPKHIWNIEDPNSFIYDTHNIHAIGSGPYKVSRVHMDNEGFPKQYTLTAFRKFVLGKPYIRHIKFSLFGNDEDLMKAFEAGLVESMHSPVQLEDLSSRKNNVIIHRPLTRMVGVFFNTEKKNPLATPEGVRILDYALDKNAITRDVYDGYAQPLSEAVPLSIISEQKNSYDAEQAWSSIAQAGWTYDETSGILRESSDRASAALSLSLATGNAPYLLATAEHIKQQLASFGITVTVTSYDSETLTETVLKKRNFDALLFGQSFQHDTALYAFWHSSQRSYPGLNITQYINAHTDTILDRARREDNQLLRFEDYRSFNELIMKDRPALFLLSPEFTYVVPRPLSVTIADYVTEPQDRFNHIYSWHIRSHSVWKLLLKK